MTSVQKAGDKTLMFVRDCLIDLQVGVYPAEKSRSQRVLVNVEVEAALRHTYHDMHDHNLDRVLDYDPLYHYISVELPKLGHIALLEAVAEKIVSFCFQDPRVEKVHVRLVKPDVYANAKAGIEIVRCRNP